MKTKNQFSIIIVITCLLTTGIVCGEDPVRGSGTDSTTSGSGNMGWQESCMRTPILNTSGLNLSTGVSANQTGFSWNFSISSNLSMIDCCRMSKIKEAWCDYNADDQRCKD